MFVLSVVGTLLLAGLLIGVSRRYVGTKAYQGPNGLGLSASSKRERNSASTLKRSCC
jgi:hypothetical protein